MLLRPLPFAADKTFMRICKKSTKWKLSEDWYKIKYHRRVKKQGCVLKNGILRAKDGEKCVFQEEGKNDLRQEIEKYNGVSGVPSLPLVQSSET